jgi:hypothetical protein
MKKECPECGTVFLSHPTLLDWRKDFCSYSCFEKNKRAFGNLIWVIMGISTFAMVLAAILGESQF